MRKKAIVIISIVLLLVVGTASAAVSYAVWDSKKSESSVEFKTGENYNVSIHTQNFTETNKLRPDGGIESSNTANEIVIEKFIIKMEECDKATFAIGEIKMILSDTESIVANEFMKVSIYHEGQLLDPAKDFLVNNGLYEVRLAFTVLSTSDLLTLDMQNKPVTVTLSVEGVKPVNA